MSETFASQPSSRTAAEYRAAFEELLAETDRVMKQMDTNLTSAAQLTADEILGSRPEPKTTAEYKAAIAELLAGIKRMNEHMDRNGAELNRLKEETTALSARTGEKLSRIAAQLDALASSG